MTALLVQALLVVMLLLTTAAAGLRWQALHVGYGSRRSAVVSLVAVVVSAAAVFMYPAVDGVGQVWVVGAVVVCVVASIWATVADRHLFRAWLEHLRHGGAGR